MRRIFFAPPLFPRLLPPISHPGSFLATRDEEEKRNKRLRGAVGRARREAALRCRRLGILWHLTRGRPARDAAERCPEPRSAAEPRHRFHAWIPSLPEPAEPKSPAQSAGAPRARSAAQPGRCVGWDARLIVFTDFSFLFLKPPFL